MLVHHEVWKLYHRLSEKHGPDTLLLAPYFVGASAYLGYWGTWSNTFGRAGRVLSGGRAAAFAVTMRDLRMAEMMLFNSNFARMSMYITRPLQALELTREAWTISTLRATSYAEGAAGISARRALARRALGKGLTRLVPYLGWAMLAYDVSTIVRHGTFWGVDVPGVPDGGWI